MCMSAHTMSAMECIQRSKANLECKLSPSFLFVSLVVLTVEYAKLAGILFSLSLTLHH